MEDGLAKTILNELKEFRKENDRKWRENNKINEILENQLKCDKEILLLKKELEIQKARMNFQNVRIESLEKWRDNLGDDFIGIS